MDAVQQATMVEYTQNFVTLHYSKASFCPSLFHSATFSASDRRCSTPSIRAAFVTSIYETLKANSPEETFIALDAATVRKLALVINITMSVIYKQNHYLDDKWNWEDGLNGKREMLGTFQLKDYLYDYINEDQALKPYAGTIGMKLRQAFRETDMGQRLDKEFNFKKYMQGLSSCPSMSDIINNRLYPLKSIIEDIKTGKTARAQFGIDLYFCRTYLISSGLFRSFAEMLSEITNAAADVTNKMVQYAEIYGVMMQLVNDISDFALEAGTSNKKSYDVLSDLKNETLSLPIIMHLEYAEDKIKLKESSLNEFKVYQYFLTKLSSNKQTEFVLEGQHNEILREMITSRALLDSMKIGNKLKRE